MGIKDNTDFLNDNFKDIKYYNGIVYLIKENENILNDIKNILKLYNINCYIVNIKDIFILAIMPKYTYKLEMEILEEKWKKSTRFPNYEASTRGRVRNKYKKVLFKKERPDGRVQYNFSDGIKSHQIFSYRFICEVFDNNTNNKLSVDHINRNIRDNRPSNLRFATMKEQNLNKGASLPKNGKKIDQLDKEGNYIKTFDRVIDASKELNIHYGHISECLTTRGKTKRNSAGGFKWRYTDISIEGEIWKKIPESYINYNCYASNKGRFRRGDDISTVTFGVKDCHGYYYIDVSGKIYKVSRLVCIAFSLLDPNSNDVVDHIDENKSNNILENLEVVSKKENNRRSLENRKLRANGENLTNVLSKVVLCINKDTNKIIKEYNCLSAVEKDGFHIGNVQSCCIGKIKSSKGYKWQYKN